jgi:hypothetical protein
VLLIFPVGAYKLLKLLSALLKNRDDKKGQQDLYKIKRLHALGDSLNMTLLTYNSLMMIKQNKVAEYFATLDTEGLAFVRAEARHLAHGSVEKLQRIQLAEHRFMKAQLNEQAREDKARRDAEKQAREDAKMQGVKLEEDESKIRKLKGIKLQLRITWHRRNGTRDPETNKLTVIGIIGLNVKGKQERLVKLAGWVKLSPIVTRVRKSPNTHRVC